jgi:hypothetical protein
MICEKPYSYQCLHGITTHCAARPAQPARHKDRVQDDYCCVSTEASFSACFAADLLSVELIVGFSV